MCFLLKFYVITLPDCLCPVKWGAVCIKSPAVEYILMLKKPEIWHKKGPCCILASTGFKDATMAMVEIEIYLHVQSGVFSPHIEVLYGCVWLLNTHRHTHTVKMWHQFMLQTRKCDILLFHILCLITDNTHTPFPHISCAPLGRALGRN